MTSLTPYALTPANEPHFTLMATAAPDEQRIHFWPQHFGTIPQWVALEPRIFAWMDRFCADYSGGICSFTPSVMVEPLWLPILIVMRNGACSTK